MVSQDGETLTCIGCEVGIADGAAHLQCPTCLLAAHPHCSGDLFQPSSLSSPSSSRGPLCRLCQQAPPRKRRGSSVAVGLTVEKQPRLDAAPPPAERPQSPPALPVDTCAVCLAGGVGFGDVVWAESCRLHRCHLACLAAWLESAPPDRASRCPGSGCGACLSRLRVLRPSDGEEDDSAGAAETVQSARLQASCPICLERLTGPVATPDTCPGHQFCPPCLRSWTGQSRLCPYDRRPFDAIQIRPGVASDIVTLEEPLPAVVEAPADEAGAAADAATDTGISDDEEAFPVDPFDFNYDQPDDADYSEEDDDEDGEADSGDESDSGHPPGFVEAVAPGLQPAGADGSSDSEGTVDLEEILVDVEGPLHGLPLVQPTTDASDSSEDEDEHADDAEYHDDVGDDSLDNVDDDFNDAAGNDSHDDVDVEKDFNNDVVEDSNVDVGDDSNDVAEDFNDEVGDYSNVDFGEDSNDEVGEDSNEEVGEDSNDEVGEDSNDEVGEDSNDEVGEDSNDEVGEDSNDEVGEDSNDEVGEDSNDEVGEDSNDEVGEDSNDEVGEDSNDEVGEDSNNDEVGQDSNVVVVDSHDDVSSDSSNDVDDDLHDLELISTNYRDDVDADESSADSDDADQQYGDSDASDASLSETESDPASEETAEYQEELSDEDDDHQSGYSESSVSSESSDSDF